MLVASNGRFDGMKSVVALVRQRKEIGESRPVSIFRRDLSCVPFLEAAPRIAVVE